jgi:hypothetical protein
MNQINFSTTRYSSIIKQIRDDDKKDPVITKYNIEDRNGKLFSDNKEIVKTEKRDEVLRDLVLNKAAPLALDQLFWFAKKQYHGLSKRFVKNWLESTEEYQMMKKRPYHLSRVTEQDKEGVVFKNSKVKKHKNLLGVDLVFTHKEWSSKKYILVCVHYATSYTWASTIKAPLLDNDKRRRKAAKHVLNAFRPMLQDCIQRFGKVTKLVSDDGGEFKAEFEAYLGHRDIIKQPIRKGQKTMCTWVEKKNSSLCRSIGSLLGMGLGFTKALKLAIQKVNNTKSRVTGKAPSEWTLQDLNKGPPKRKFRTMPEQAKKKAQPEFEVDDRVRHLTPYAQGKSVFWKSYESTSVKKRGTWSRIYKIISKDKIYGTRGYKYLVNGEYWKSYQLQKVPEKTISIKLKKPVAIDLVNPAFEPIRPQGRIQLRAQPRRVRFVDLSLDD